MQKTLIVLFTCVLVNLTILSLGEKSYPRTEDNYVRPKSKAREAIKKLLGEIILKPVINAIINATKKSAGRLRRRRPSFLQLTLTVNQPQPRDLCSGNNQSPIDIIKSQVKLNTSLYLKFTSFHDSLQGVYALNDGRTVMLSLPENVEPILSGPAVEDEEYHLESIHFHWGSRDVLGSEHAIDGRKYAMEAHFVHFNAKYKSLREALKHSDGLVVLAAFYKVSDENNPLLKPLINSVNEVSSYGSRHKLQGDLSLFDLLPKDLKVFFRYRGSLTTPPCHQVVTWIVFPTPIAIGRDQMRSFRSLKGNRTYYATDQFISLQDNWRSLQQSNNRLIQASYISKSL